MAYRVIGVHDVKPVVDEGILQHTVEREMDNSKRHRVFLVDIAEYLDLENIVLDIQNTRIKEEWCVPFRIHSLCESVRTSARERE